ncbi:MAG: amidohydrolase family protein, partial [bacterium]
NGRIAMIGTSVTVPPMTKTLDVGGADVYPGFINGRSTIGLAEPGARGYDDTNEMLDYNPQLRALVSFHSDSEAIPVARANGITTVAVTPSGGTLSGQVALMNLDGWTWEENTLREVAGIAFQFPTIGPAGGRGFGPPPAGPDAERERNYEDLKKERDAKLEDLAKLFDRARAYAAAGPDRPIDWVLEALVPVVERKIPLITRVDRERDIRDAVRFADRLNVRLVISGGIEAPLVAPLLAEKGIPVILGSVLTLPPREDMAHSWSYEAAAELARAKIKFAFATGDNTNVRQLPYQAAESVAWGLSREDALKALTIDAAEILGVADLVGSIEAGKIANLVVVKGDPLEVRSEVTHVIIRGRDVGVANKHLALYERYMGRP